MFKQQHYQKLYKLTKDHKFWETEKINNPLHKQVKEGQIEEIDHEKYKNSQPIPLPAGFEWDELDPNDDK